MKGMWNWIILTLSLYVIVVLSLEVVSDWSEHTIAILETIDLVICIIFLADWFYFLSKAEDKKLYFKTRFLDLISSIPFAQALRAFRVFRLVRLLRLLRGMKAIMPLMRIVTKNKMRSALVTYLFCTVIIFLYCSLGIFNFEKGLNSSVTCFGDSLWMAFTTMTSVGYGDIFPITTGGRIMAVLLVTTGMGLFSLVTAEFATLFLSYINEAKQSEATSNS